MKNCFRVGRRRLVGFLWLVLTTILLILSPAWASGEDLPVVVPDLPASSTEIRNDIAFAQLRRSFEPAPDGLALDLGDPSLHGKVYIGQYPFAAGEADYNYTRYRLSAILSGGKATLPLADLFKEKYNANKWPPAATSTPHTAAYRLDLWRLKDGAPVHMGFYDGVVAFRHEGDKFVKNLSIVEGPFVGQLSSDDPGTLVIVWRTDKPASGKVSVYPARWKKSRVTVGGKKFPAEEPSVFSAPQPRADQKVTLSGLQPDNVYLYVAESITADGESVTSGRHSFRTPPEKGEGQVTFACTGDSRAGIGGGEHDYMGVNLRTLSRIASYAFRNGAELLLFTGDLANGYTSKKEDFRIQLKAWKQAVSGFWRSRPIYVGIGNHEALVNSYNDNSRSGLSLDKWPYVTDSTEAVFANEFVNPSNGPIPCDPTRPPYAGTVFKFHYGPVLFISCNNNYWRTTDAKVGQYGGSPEGYILEDQLVWIETALNEAESDPAVRYIVLFAHEPIFPCGGHVKDSMWWKGDNNVRAYTKQGDTLTREKLGIIEVRNRLWKAVSGSSKVAVVLTSHEHAYHRTLITKKTPVGVYPRDDTNNDGILDTYSPNPDFMHPTWHITVGTAGAPYYSIEKDTPWTPEIFSSEEGYAMFHANSERISLKFIGITGQVLDEIPDLMAVKRERGDSSM